MSERSPITDPDVDLHAQIDVDGQVSVDDLPVPIEGSHPEAAVEAVVATAAELAAQLGHPVIAAVSDLRPGRFPQRHRVHADGRSERVWPGDPRDPAEAEAATSLQAAVEDTFSAAAFPGFGGRAPGGGASGAVPAQPGAERDGAAARTGRGPDPRTAGHRAAEPPTVADTRVTARPANSPGSSMETLDMSPAGTNAPARTPAPAPVPAPPGASSDGLPTVHDLLGGPAERAARVPAQQGWRRGVRRASGGLVALAPGRAERSARAAHRTVQKPLDGPKTVVVVNPKGGAHKTTATLLLAATFGTCRGGYTLAWDNNESRGTLGWRSRPAAHRRTAVDLLAEAERIAATPQAGVGDVDAFVRGQGDSQFDVLASDERVDAETLMDGGSFDQLHTLLRRFYRILVVDTGNNMRADNWAAAVRAADALVVVSTLREDTAASAAWMIDALREGGHGAKVARAVTVLSDSGPKQERALVDRLTGHFRRHTRSVVRVPYDEALVAGGRTGYAELGAETREAWMFAAAAVADGLD